MKKKYKGFTIVEVMIAMTILLIVSLSTYTLCLTSCDLVGREDAYLQFNSIFSDIHVFELRHKDKWNYYFFDETGDSGIHYYDSSFNEVESDSVTALYKLEYAVVDSKIVINVINLDTNENLYTNYVIDYS